MPHFATTARVPYAQMQAFSLVSDIAAYPDFIKWIKAMRVSDRRSTGPGQEMFIGDAVVRFRGVAERFKTQVLADTQAGIVKASLLEGPFQRLEAVWTIVALERGGCDISLGIDYAFRNRLIGMLAAANLDLAVNRVMAAFLDEARRRFGPETIATAPSTG
jgi:coenzyme Q-binding protein COQ10